MEIKAAVINKIGDQFDIQNILLDENLNNDEVLVKIVATGLCHTDLAVLNGHLPFVFPAILGLEGAGIVVKTGASITKVKEGDHVILAPSSCGKCEQCISGHPSFCQNFMQLNFSGQRKSGENPFHTHTNESIHGFFFGQSSFGTSTITSESNLVKVEKDIPLEILGPLGCGIQTGAGSVLNVMKLKAGESIAVFGVGPVGLAAIMAAKANGSTTIIAVDVLDNKLEVAKQLGATHSINSRNEKSSERILSLTNGKGVNYFLDTTARNEVIAEAVSGLKILGKGILVGAPTQEKLEIPYVPFQFGKSVQYVLSGDSIPDIFIPQLISLYKKGLFPFDKLITFYEFEEISNAVDDFKQGKVMKAIFKMPQ
jgi:aryl-alcohol dehydrogenase